MPRRIDIPEGDLDRATTHEPNYDYPEMVEIRLRWPNKNGKPNVRSHEISADEYFGRGSYGAPLPAEALVGMIERMRREGP